MKKWITFLFVIGSYTCTCAQQIAYDYDGSGNKKKRLTLSPPPAIYSLDLSAESDGEKAILSVALLSSDKITDLQIERLAQNGKWEYQGEPNNSYSSNRYFFNDDYPLRGKNEYRAKAVGAEGIEIYSEPKAIDFDLQLLIFPNPVKNLLTIENKAITYVDIIDKTGRVVLKPKKIEGGRWDVSSLISGEYVVRAWNTKNESFVAKIIKQ